MPLLVDLLSSIFKDMKELQAWLDSTVGLAEDLFNTDWVAVSGVDVAIVVNKGDGSRGNRDQALEASVSIPEAL